MAKKKKAKKKVKIPKELQVSRDEVPVTQAPAPKVNADLVSKRRVRACDAKGSLKANFRSVTK